MLCVCFVANNDCFQSDDTHIRSHYFTNLSFVWFFHDNKIQQNNFCCSYSALRNRTTTTTNKKKRMAQWGRITLWDASADGDVEMVKKRLKMELAKINAQDPQGKTALHEACRWDHAEVAQLLIDEGADPEIYDEEGCTPLHVAAQFGQLNAIKCLLKNNAWFDAQTWNMDTPLHSASGGGHPEAVKILLEAGADAELKNTQNKKPKDVAANSDTGAAFREKTYVSPTKYDGHEA